MTVLISKTHHIQVMRFKLITKLHVIALNLIVRIKLTNFNEWNDTINNAKTKSAIYSLKIYVFNFLAKHIYQIICIFPNDSFFKSAIRPTQTSYFPIHFITPPTIKSKKIETLSPPTIIPKITSYHSNSKTLKSSSSLYILVMKLFLETERLSYSNKSSL